MIVNDSLFVRGPLVSAASAYAPAGSYAQTMPRDTVRDSTSVLVSGTAYVRQFYSPIGQAITNLSVLSEQAESGGSHCWAGVLDYQLILRAVSTDNVGGTFLAGGGVPITFAVTSGGTYNPAFNNGPFYAVVCAVFSGTAPTLAGVTLAAGVATISPAFCGTSSTGLSTPPALGTQFAAISGNGAFNYYAWAT